MVVTKSISKEKCPVCGSENIVEDPVKGEVYCANCGTVIEENIIDLSQDWRAFNHEQMESRARAGAPLTFTKHDKGLSTQIGKGLTELYKVSPEKRIQYYRLTKWNKRLMRSKDRNLTFALSELQRVVSYLNLPKNVHEKVAKLYEEVVDKGLVRGRSIESIIAALIYYVAREAGTPRTLDEIAEASGIDKREIGRTYRYVARELGLRILPAKPEDFVPRFCFILGLSEKVQMKAIKLLKKAEKVGATSGKGPTGVAAAAIYIASVLEGERRTQREIADLCGITEVTIRNRYKELVEKLGIEEIVEKKEAELEAIEEKRGKRSKRKRKKIKK